MTETGNRRSKMTKISYKMGAIKHEITPHFANFKTELKLAKDIQKMKK